VPHDREVALVLGERREDIHEDVGDRHPAAEREPPGAWQPIEDAQAAGERVNGGEGESGQRACP